MQADPPVLIFTAAQENQVPNYTSTLEFYAEFKFSRPTYDS